MRIVRRERYHRSVRNNLLDDKLGVLRLKSYIAAKRRDEYVPTFCSDTRNTVRENSGIAAFNGQLVDGNQSPSIRAMMKLDALEDASRKRQISAMRTSDGNCAVARLGQILRDRPLSKRPDPAPEQCKTNHNTNCCRCNDDNYCLTAMGYWR